jgi:hypothetical protein
LAVISFCDSPQIDRVAIAGEMLLARLALFERQLPRFDSLPFEFHLPLFQR